MDILDSVPTVTPALFHGSESHNGLIAHPHPQMSKWNESLQILNDCCTSLKLSVSTNINCYGKNSLWIVNIPRRTSSCCQENLPWVLVFRERSDGCTSGHMGANAHLHVTENAFHRPSVCSPTDTGVWAIPQVSFKLTFGNVHQGCEYSQLVEDRFCWQDIIYGW